MFCSIDSVGALPMQVTGQPSVNDRIERAFQVASSTTGTSFDYLVRTAIRESNLDPQAKAATSSAAGTFQFIESTWLETLKQAGGRFGLDRYADQIERTSSGRFVVEDPAMRQKILDLRHDPEVSALMAGALTQKNSDILQNYLGRPPSDGELYIAHFLGASGAKRLIGLAQSSPQADASAAFAKQARANKPIFFDANGAGRSAQAVYENLINRHDGTQLIGAALASVQPIPKPNIAPRTVAAVLPVAKPEIDPTPVTAAERVAAAWNIALAGDEPVNVSNALKIAAQAVAPGSPDPAAGNRPSRFAQADADERDRNDDPESVGRDNPPAVPVTVSSTVAQLAGSAGVLPKDPVTTPFNAKAPRTAFESLYRTDALSPRHPVGDLSAMAYATQTSLFSTLDSATEQAVFGAAGLAIPQSRGTETGLPLDLGNYRRRDEERRQRDLLPPV
ncbi:MAG: lytic transglycosylase domain-containing protein [Pseudomonadota bacterium]